MTASAGRPASRLARAASALLALIAVAGCGDPPPLERLTEVQRTQLDAAWTARISATDTAAITGAARNERSKALYAACQPLDPTNPLLAAVAGICGPTASFQKLAVLLPERCAEPAAICIRALDRIASAAEQEGEQFDRVTQEARKLITEPACLAQFSPTPVQLAGYGELAAAYRVMALGVERKEADITALGQRKIDDAQGTIAPKGTIQQRTAQFRADCLQQG